MIRVKRDGAQVAVLRLRAAIAGEPLKACHPIAWSTDTHGLIVPSRAQHPSVAAIPPRVDRDETTRWLESFDQNFVDIGRHLHNGILDLVR